MDKNLLGPKDPEGYYVVRIPRKLLDRIMKKYENAIKIIEIGDDVLIRTKSRKIALSIIKMYEEAINKNTVRKL